MTIMIPKENTTVVYCGVFCAFALFEFSPLFVLFFLKVFSSIACFQFSLLVSFDMAAQRSRLKRGSLAPTSLLPGTGWIWATMGHRNGVLGPEGAHGSNFFTAFQQELRRKWQASF